MRKYGSYFRVAKKNYDRAQQVTEVVFTQKNTFYFLKPLCDMFLLYSQETLFFFGKILISFENVEPESSEIVNKVFRTSIGFFKFLGYLRKIQNFGNLRTLSKKFLESFQKISYLTRHVGRGGAMGANAPPPLSPRTEKVRLEGSKDELTKKKERQR